MSRIRNAVKNLLNMKWYHIVIFWAATCSFILMQFVVATDTESDDEHVETAWVVPLDAYGAPEVLYNDGRLRLKVFTSDTTNATWSYQPAIWATLNDSLDGFRLRKTVRGDHFILTPDDTDE